MRLHLVRFLAFSLVVIGIALLGSGFASVVHLGGGPPLSQAYAKKTSPVGQWNLIVTFPDGSQIPSTLRFNTVGTMTNYTPGPGIGTWRMTGSNQFQYQFQEKILDKHGKQTSYVDVQQQATLSTSGTTYTAFGTGTVYAMDGSILAVNQTTTVATSK